MPVNAHTIWSSGAILGYCTDTTYDPKAGLYTACHVQCADAARSARATWRSWSDSGWHHCSRAGVWLFKPQVLAYNRPMSPAPAPPPIPENMSEIGRLAGVFFSPMAAFADIARRPRWWIPMILIGVLSTAAVVAFSQHIGWDEIIRKSIEQNNPNATAQQRQQAMYIASRITPLIAYIAPFTAAFSIVVIAGVLILFTNVMMGADISFTSMMGVVGYGGIPPTVVATALTILVMFLKNPEDFDLNNPLAFNVGAFLPDGSARWLVTLLGSLDLFSFWRIGLLAGGISAAAPKIKFGKALVAVIIPWLVYVALRTGAASLGG